jgi:tetratricopeptide (TPR) repeat protein
MRTIVFILLAISGVAAQNHAKIDSLQGLLENASGISKADIYCKLAVEYYRADPELSLCFFNEALAIGPQSGPEFVRTWRRKAQTLITLNRLNEAELVLEELRPIAEECGDFEEIGRITSLDGLVFLQQGRYAAALRRYAATAILYEKANFAYGFAALFGNVGLIHFKLGDERRCIEYSTRALQYATDNNDMVAMLHSNIALSYEALGEFALAREHVEKSIEKCFVNECRMQVNFILALLDSGESLEEAKRYYKTSLNIANKLADFRMQVDNLRGIGNLFLRQKYYDSALCMLQEASNIARKNGLIHPLSFSYKKQLEVFHALEHVQGTIASQDSLISINEELRSGDLLREFAVAEINLEEKLNSLILASQNQQLNIKTSIHLYHTITLVAIAVIVVALAMICSVLCFALYKKNERRKLLACLVESRKSRIVNEHTRVSEWLGQGTRRFHLVRSKLLALAADTASNKPGKIDGPSTIEYTKVEVGCPSASTTGYAAFKQRGFSNGHSKIIPP